MRIPALGIEKKRAVVILGAGASRGASCFEGSLLPPPLDADFFSLMERVQHKDKVVRDLLEFVKQEFGETTFPRMEELFTQIEALSVFHTQLKIQAGRAVKKYSAQLESFVASVARFFHHVFVDDASSSHKTCKYHDQLAQVLHAGDTVISFNYDCLMDDSLRRRAGNSWNPERGYGVALHSTATKTWQPETIRGRPADVPVRLLKLHGSLNWDRSRGQAVDDLRLRAKPYNDRSRTADEVVPPVWDKTVGKDPILQELWKSARRALPTGPILVVVGYSVPSTDMLSQALIRAAASERAKHQKLSHIVVVNPDGDARRRMIRLVQGGLDSHTCILELDRLAELAQLLE